MPYVDVDAILKSLLTSPGDTIAASAPGIPSRIAAPASGRVWTGQGVGVLPAWAAGGAGAMTLLKANSGQVTTTAAHDLDSVAISGLTLGDSLLVVVRVRQMTVDGLGSWELRDGAAGAGNATIPNLFAAVAAAYNGAFLRIGRYQDGDIRTWAVGQNWVSSGAPGHLGATSVVHTGWTTPWTLYLRSGGQNATGTEAWEWQVYKVASV